jgi:hypothetical protein
MAMVIRDGLRLAKRLSYISAYPMTIQARPPQGRGDGDGIRIVPIPRGRRAYWLIGLAVALPIAATLAAVAIIRWSPSSEAGAAAARTPGAGDMVANADEPAGHPRPVPSPGRTAGHVVPRRVVAAPVAEPAGLGATPVPEPQKPRREIDAADVIVALREEGVHEGIAAFGIPGSHPPKSGILVPEEFELPEGYVRHYQSTDDGEQLPAILMFHPDYEFVNEQGEVVKVPEDGVVPPEMAPPGLAVDQVLVVPERKGGEPIR